MRQIKVSSNSAKLFNKGDRMLLGHSPQNQERVVVVNSSTNTLTIRPYNKFDEDDVEGFYDERD